jgi:hypothetical protein
MNQELLKDPRVEKLVDSPIRPTLYQIGPLAKEMGITSAQKLWDLFDFIQLKWSEQKDCCTSLEDLG